MGPNYVNKNQAKSLKEKGFDVKVRRFLDLITNQEIDDAPLGNYNLTRQSLSIPEQHQVVEWLLTNHGIFILVLPQDKSAVDFRTDKSKYPHQALFFSIIKYEKDCSCKEIINTSDNKGELFLHFDTLQEAYSAAFNYVLKNLI